MKSDIILIDVGANHGEFSCELARRNPDLKMYAIEPEPNLFKLLQHRAEQSSLHNHIACDVAISMQEGKVDFHVSHSGDWGTSSLLPFDSSHLANDEYWKQRPDLLHQETIRVRAIRMDSFLKDMDFDEIGFLKIDAQGLDLDVMRSMGDFLPRLQGGMLEAVTVPEKSLYQGEVDDLRAVLNFMAENNFDVYAIKPNDPATNEVNVFFKRRDIDAALLEEKYHLRNFFFYDGKHYNGIIPDASYYDINHRYTQLTQNHQQLTETHQQLLLDYQSLTEDYRHLLSIHERLGETHQKLFSAHQKLNETHQRLLSHPVLALLLKIRKIFHTILDGKTGAGVC